jgi:hypothetical protein
VGGIPHVPPPRSGGRLGRGAPRAWVQPVIPFLRSRSDSLLRRLENRHRADGRTTSTQNADHEPDRDLDLDGDLDRDDDPDPDPERDLGHDPDPDPKSDLVDPSPRKGSRQGEEENDKPTLPLSVQSGLSVVVVVSEVAFALGVVVGVAFELAFAVAVGFEFEVAVGVAFVPRPLASFLFRLLVLADPLAG